MLSKAKSTDSCYSICLNLTALEFMSTYWFSLAAYFVFTLNSTISICLHLLQVQQEEVSEIDILVKDLRVLRHSNYTVPLKESMLYSIPRDNDVLFTLPNLSGKGLFLNCCIIFLSIIYILIYKDKITLLSQCCFAW